MRATVLLSSVSARGAARSGGARCCRGRGWTCLVELIASWCVFANVTGARAALLGGVRCLRAACACAACGGWSAGALRSGGWCAAGRLAGCWLGGVGRGFALGPSSFLSGSVKPGTFLGCVRVVPLTALGGGCDPVVGFGLRSSLFHVGVLAGLRATSSMSGVLCSRLEVS